MTNTYGNRLNEALRLANRERQELADAIAVSVQAVGQVIAGKTKALTAENSERAARFLRVDPYWLATGEGTPDAKPGATAAPWPFSMISPEQWAGLSDLQRGRIEGYAESVLKEPAPVKSSGHPKAA